MKTTSGHRVSSTSLRGKALFRILYVVILLYVTLPCASALAGEAPATETGGTGAAFRQALAWLLSLDPFALGLLVLFLATVIGVVVKGRSRDRCLKGYHGFPVKMVLDTVSKTGRLLLGNAGLELVPETPEPSDCGNRTGFLLYANEYGRLRFIVRDPAALDRKQAARRIRLLRNTVRPGIFRKTRRWLSNIAGSFKDAFNDFLNMVMGRIRPHAVSELAKGREKYTGQMRQDITSLLPNSSYDAILERLLGKKVEVEVTHDDMPVTIAGTLAEYTATYVSLLDAVIPGDPVDENALQIEEEEQNRTVTNVSGRTVFVRKPSRMILNAGAETVIPKDAEPVFIETFDADILLPRKYAVPRFRLKEN